MIEYSSKFHQANNDLRKEVRWVIEVSFDLANTDLYYFTSHADCEVPPGTPDANVIYSVVKKPVVTSQKLDPRSTKFSIGSLTFDLIDKDRAVTNLLNTKLAGGDGLRRKRVRVRRGYAGLLWADYQIPPGGTQLVEGKTSYNKGVYTFRCNDIQRTTKKNIFDQKKTNLLANYTASVGDVPGDTVITVPLNGTDDFEMVAHGPSFTDAPNATVGYLEFKVDGKKNIIRYTGKTASTFTGCVGGRFNTKDFSVSIDDGDNVPSHRQPEIKEHIYLELPAPKMAKTILMGTDPVVPPHWTLGIDPAYVNTAQFGNIGIDLYDPADDTKGAMLRFDGRTKIDGKKFLQEQVNLRCGCFMPVLSTGELGYKRMTGVLSGAAPVTVLDASNVMSYSALDSDNKNVANEFAIHWNKLVSKEKPSRTNVYSDAISIGTHQLNNPIELTFDGLHGSIHSDAALQSMFNTLRDRYAGPPLLITVKCFDSLNAIEVGDIVWCRFKQRDFNGGGDLDRAFEVIGYKASGKDVVLYLFGSSQKAGFIVANPDAANDLDDAFYSVAAGLLPANKLDVATTGSLIGGVWHITADSTLVGGNDMNDVNNIYWYDSDVTVDADVTLTLTQNAQPRIMGTFTRNGYVDLSGNGRPGTTRDFFGPMPGTPGYYGSTKAGHGYRLPSGAFAGISISAVDEASAVVRGANDVIPELVLTNNGTSLVGIPADMRPSSGGGGMDIVTPGILGDFALAAGGDGGNGGAAVVFIARGFAAGASGSYLLNGGKGQVGGVYNKLGFAAHPDRTLYAGAGASGAPAVCYFLVDGNTSAVPSISEFTAEMPEPDFLGSPSNNLGGISFVNNDEPWPVYNRDSGFYGFQNLREGAVRIQSIPSSTAPVADVDDGILAPPTALGVASGTAQLLKQSDGTITARALASWTASTDARVVGYHVRYKQSSESLYSFGPMVIGRDNVQAFVIEVSTDELWDFGVQSVGADGVAGDWVDFLNHPVLGKSERPADVTGFVAAQNAGAAILKWNQVSDIDLAGYELRYMQPVGANWEDSTPLTEVTRGTSITNADLPPGEWVLFCKAVDTTGNYSLNAATHPLVFSRSSEVILQEQQAPDWLGTKVNFVKHWTGKLIPSDQHPPSYYSGFDNFSFVPTPALICTYESPEQDGGFDDNVGVWGVIESALGPGVTEGVANPGLLIDYRLAAGAYDGFEPWSIGKVSAQYVKHMLRLDTSVGKAVVTGFLPTLDQDERVEKGRGVVVTPGGTAVVFDAEYHKEPYVEITVIAATALIGTAVSVSTAGFTVHVFDNTGADVGGVVNWKAESV